MTGRGLLVAQVGRAKGVRNARAWRTLAGCKDMARTEAGSNSIAPITLVTYFMFMSLRAGSGTVFLNCSYHLIFLSEGFPIFRSFQALEGANCVGYCTCLPVLASLLLNRQSCCADADISFNMLHVFSCALAFHLFSQNKLR